MTVITMRRVFKKYFIPQAENNFKPHILRTKRTVLYSAILIATKVILVTFALLVPAEAYLLPDVLAEQGQKLLQLTNDLRHHEGGNALAANQKLYVSSDGKARDMAIHGYFSHTGPDKRNLNYFLTQANYTYRVAGENLAVGFPDAEAIFSAWVKSPPHHANLVDGDFKELGIGLASGLLQGQPTVYVAEHFGTPADAPVVAEDIVKTKHITRTPTARSKTTTLASAVRGEKITTILVADHPSLPPDPLQKYLHAKRVLSPLTNLFSVARALYLGCLIFFVAALALTIFIKIRQQHFQVIFQTVLLLALTFAFYKV